MNIVRIINKNRKGEIITDISKVKLPEKLEKEVFEVINPNFEYSLKDESA